MKSFNELKALVTSEPVLRQFNNSLPTAIFSDSSDAQAGSFIAQAMETVGCPSHSKVTNYQTLKQDTIVETKKCSLWYELAGSFDIG